MCQLLSTRIVVGVQDLTTLRILELVGIDAPEVSAPPRIDRQIEAVTNAKARRKAQTAEDFTTLSSVEASVRL